jgi:hypothetical protein
MSVLPENSILAFGWLLQRVIEELENLKGNELSIKSEKKKDLYTIYIGAEITSVTDSINDILKSADLNSDSLALCENEPVLMLIIKIFYSEGVIIKIGQSFSDKLVIGFPIGD